MSRGPPPPHSQQRYYDPRPPPPQQNGYHDAYQQDWQQQGGYDGYDDYGHRGYDPHYEQHDPYYANDQYYEPQQQPRPPPDPNWNRRPPPPQQRPPPQQQSRAMPIRNPPPPRGPPSRGGPTNGYGPRPQPPPEQPHVAPHRDHRAFQQESPEERSWDNPFPTFPANQDPRAPPPQGRPSTDQQRHDSRQDPGAPQPRPDPRGPPQLRVDQQQGYDGYGGNGGYQDSRQQAPRQQKYRQPDPRQQDPRQQQEQQQRPLPPSQNGQDSRNRDPLPQFTSIKHQPPQDRPGTATGARGPLPKGPLPPHSATVPSTPVDGNFGGQFRQAPPIQRAQEQNHPRAGTNFSRPQPVPTQYAQPTPAPQGEVPAYDNDRGANRGPPQPMSPVSAQDGPYHRPIYENEQTQPQRFELPGDAPAYLVHQSPPRNGPSPRPFGAPPRSQTAEPIYPNQNIPQNRPFPQRQMTDGAYPPHEFQRGTGGPGLRRDETARPSLDSRRPPPNTFGLESPLPPPGRPSIDPAGRPGSRNGSRPNTANVERPGYYPAMDTFGANGAPIRVANGGQARGPNGVPMAAPPRSGSLNPAGANNAAPSDPPGPPALARQRSDPDALPYHPSPVRPGLAKETPPDQQKPIPVRQYNNTGKEAAPPSSISTTSKRKSLPVTPAELDTLRSSVARAPSNYALHLELAKKLVEASIVLANEGGRADQKTTRNNHVRYITEAHKIVKKLVAADYPPAMFYLADCYGEGSLGLAYDAKEAFLLYQSAAKMNHPQAAYRTAVCCEIGLEEGGGTKRDYQKALQWYRRSATLGDVPAMYKMGIINLRGLLGVEKNLGEAVQYLKKAAEKADEENPHALHELGLLYESSNSVMQRDERTALEYFTRAAKLGYKGSQFKLGQLYEQGLLGCPIDARNSIIWYTKAAAQGEHQSELALSGWYLTGADGILEHSDTEAYLWARKAASADPPLPKAMFAMGYFTEVGIGCPRSLEEAKRWYGRSAAHNFTKAKERLEELRRGGQRAQKSRENISRSNQKQNEENCTIM